MRRAEALAAPAEKAGADLRGRQASHQGSLMRMDPLAAH